MRLRRLAQFSEFHQVGAFLLIFSLALLSLRCTVQRTRKLPAAEVLQPEQETIVGITTIQGRDISFDHPPGAFVREGTVRGEIGGKLLQFSLDEVQRFWVLRKETSTARTIGLVAAVVGGAAIATAAIAAATKNSCPFVYSWNGEEFVFDAEPYGGAITRGLEKDDIAELQHLKPADDIYRLLLRNEVPETQYTNVMELLVVEHPLGTRVIPDQHGTMHTVENLVLPTSAVNASGRDLRPWICRTDRLIWEKTTLPAAGNPLRDEIILTFPRPAGAEHAKLVTNVATGLWGSYMIREILALKGDELDSWYELVDGSPEAANSVHAWSRSTQTYALNLEILEANGWKTRGVLLGEGPFNSEDRITLLDLRQVQDDRLTIRLRPPFGFWAFNSIAVDYSEPQSIHETRILPSRARDGRGRDLVFSLSAVDDVYYAMPQIGDFAVIDFPVPKEVPNNRRTLFLHSRGFYRLHLPGKGPAMKAITWRLQTDPDFILRMANQRFKEWKDRSREIGY